MFYMTRPLPNVFALPIVLFAISYWLRGQNKPFIICSGIAILVFRFELALFLGLLLALNLLQQKLSIDGMLKIALPAGVSILAATVLVDSFFWRRFLWPEGEVLWYNTILNKSSNWGTSPFLWYFYSALPRAMAASLLFVPIGIYLESRVRPLALSALVFVLLYSVLPHKELRFIIYVLPVLNIVAACACHRIWLNSAKSAWHGFLALCAGGHLLLNVGVTIFLLLISGTNYPGGAALSRLHRLELETSNVSVHIDNLSAQSGVSRFMEIRDSWTYSKDETMNYTTSELDRFTHLLVEAKNKHNTELWNALQEDFDTLEFIDCFNSIGIQYNSLMPVRIKTKPCIGILKKRMSAKVSVKAKAKKAGTKLRKEKKAEAKVKSHEIGDVDATVETTDSLLTLETPLAKDTEIVKPAEIEKKEAGDQAVFNTEFVELRSVIEQRDREINDKNSVQTDDDDDDGVVANVDEASIELGLDSPTKEINFQELRNLALGKATQKTRAATKSKIRRIIEQHYRGKGRHIENDSKEQQGQKTSVPGGRTSMRQSVKSIIKQEKIKEMIEQIATMDLTQMCNLDVVSTKDCLKQVIDKMDEKESKSIV
ncbi:probable Dol-P-Man:Man(7)GlcNAc(2)-PP-Dol alpha-1,6-mannosyltransferase isoform X2 [Scaptodrosophila lebanonensis]|nr:probable Dol-P-Man:Man(7)GlcNAc(2)-PP-Dol alpha-1,6-mannosyltransferase isoform X2 [Scaptodrosophila lebanonensis]